MSNLIRNETYDRVSAGVNPVPFRQERRPYMNSVGDLEVTECTPLMLRRIERKPQTSHPTASHMTVVTTGGMAPEMHDQREDATR